MKLNITYNIFFIIILVITILMYVFYKMYDQVCLNPPVEVYDSKIAGPTILIVSGTHGNETAPIIAIKEFFEKNKPVLGKVIVIKNVNYCGYLLNQRVLPVPFKKGIDLNRTYNTSSTKINTIVADYANKADYVFDFHEALGFKYFKDESVGNTISTFLNIADCNNLIQLLNTTFNEVEWIPFIRRNEDIIPGTLFDYCIHNHINYTLTETSKRNDMKLRVAEHTAVLNYILNKYLK